MDGLNGVDGVAEIVDRNEREQQRWQSHDWQSHDWQSHDWQSDRRLQAMERMRSQLRSRDFGQELETARLMIQRLVCLAELYDSPQTLLLFSREIARQLDAMGNLVLRAQVQQEADSIIGRLMEDILGEMNGEG